jgi:hypothetical protein
MISKVVANVEPLADGISTVLCQRLFYTIPEKAPDIEAMK